MHITGVKMAVFALNPQKNRRKKIGNFSPSLNSTQIHFTILCFAQSRQQLKLFCQMQILSAAKK